MTYPFRVKDQSNDWADEAALRLIDMAKALPRENAQRLIASELRHIEHNGGATSARSLARKLGSELHK